MCSGVLRRMRKERVQLNTQFLFRILQGALIGLGAVLPGISGGVLAVIFGVYQPIMECLANPMKGVKKYFRMLLPIGVGVIVGFLGIAKVLAFLLDRYPNPSVCLFVGLIVGMLPSLYREAGEQGRNKNSFVAMGAAFAVVLALLVTLKVIQISIVPNFAWYLFCGFCLALSVIAPGMSFSTLLMPLGLYTPFIEGIGNIDFGVLVPGGSGALATVILFSQAVNYLIAHHYSVMFHAIIGIVVAATIVIVPFASFTTGISAAVINIVCLAAGVAAALKLDQFNSSIEKK